MTEREKAAQDLLEVRGWLRHMQTVGFLGDVPQYRQYEQWVREAIRLLNRSEWISVEDRLPEGRGEIYAEGLEDSATVLAACITQDGRRKCGLATYVRDHELPGDSGWCGIIDETEAIDDRYTKVTHWMPLPEPPEVEA
jgi:hypothetical protein